MRKGEYQKKMFYLVNGKYPNPEGGVYQIKCKVTGQIYIGSTNNFERRFAIHLFELENKTHHNYKLQTDFTHLGHSNFEFIRVHSLGKRPNRNSLYDLEQKYIDEFKPYYNIQLTVERVKFTRDKKGHVAKVKKPKILKEEINNIQLDTKGRPIGPHTIKFKRKDKKNKNRLKSNLFSKNRVKKPKKHLAYLKEANEINNRINQRRKELGK